ncbi:hypothetical protein BDW66DRAFT_128457 [Aspergillus desertorum]
MLFVLSIESASSDARRIKPPHFCKLLYSRQQACFRLFYISHTSICLQNDRSFPSRQASTVWKPAMKRRSTKRWARNPVY